MRTSSFVSLTLAGVLCTGTAAFGEEAKNVILMVSDGIGFNGWEAAKYYQGGLPYDNDDFHFYGMTNYNANGIDPETGLGYDPAKYWGDFEYQHKNATDSAAAGTSLNTGIKTYSGAISVDLNQNPVPTFAEIVAGKGKATGAVSSVQYNHATPAVVDAHNVSRNNYGEIAADMLSSDLDVIMGGDSQAPGASQIYQDAANAGFTVVNDDNLADWDDLADGDGMFRGGTTPSKVFGGFSGATTGGREAPTLATMTKAALGVLEQDQDGMYLMVEGGAVDWYNHGNDMESMLRDQVDFDMSVKAAMDWVESKSSWEETLLIVTSDHETGAIWGPDMGEYDQVVDNGEGNMPGHSYNSGGHTNALVPLWARGAGAELFEIAVDGTDYVAAGFWDQFGGTEGWDGDYVDATDVFAVMSGDVTEPVAPPGPDFVFQEGLNDYAGTEDKEIRSSGGDSANGEFTQISVDGDDGSPGRQPNQGLIRFSNILGDGPNQLGADDPVEQALLILQVNNPGSGFSVHQMLAAWDESTTWEDLIDGVSPDGTEALSEAIAVFGENNGGENVSVGALEIDITEVVQQLQAGLIDDIDLALLPFENGTNGIDFYTSEFSNPDLRPSIEITLVPEPSSLVLMALGSLAIMHRSRRRA
ncbi:MAG: alkaline phosphatase [Phycisphaeraceae bacterium]